MRTKIVYVLVSQETDYYYEMLLLSLYSLRLHHPKGDAEVEVVMDEDTHQRLVYKKAEMLSDIEPIVVPIPPEYAIMQRSRFLKTQLRQLVKGDFLFLDCDTLVCAKLDEIDKVDADIAMVSDANNKSNKRTPYAKELCEKAGLYNLEGCPYFNSGVIFTRDTSSASSFFSDWHLLWQETLAKGIPQDQPALCKVNTDYNYLIQELYGGWNCQEGCKDAFEYVNSAKVLHYFTNFSKRHLVLFLLQQIKESGTIDSSIIKIAQKPREIGHSFFTMPRQKMLKFILSEQLYVFDTIPKLNKLTNIITFPFLNYIEKNKRND